jgi:hypothetical protein
MTDRHPDLVLCARYSDAPTASIAIGALSAHDIPAIADNEIMNTILPPAGSIRLMVRRHDLEQAQAILADGGLLEQ